MALPIDQIPLAGRDVLGGALIEPRGFWDIARLYTPDDPATFTDATTVQLDRENFRNGARWPIILTRLAIAPVGYQLARYAGTPDGTDTTFRNDGCNLAYAEVIVDAPQRQNYAKNPLVLRAVQARPTAEPPMQFSTPAYGSNLWNVCRMAFDHPLVLPGKGAIEVGVGSTISPGGFSSATGYINIEERGGIWPGSSRLREIEIGPIRRAANLPWGPDSFGSAEPPAATTSPIPPEGVFNANEFIKQNPARGQAGGNVFDAINVHINQLTWDETAQALGAVAGSPVSSLFLNVPCQARTRAGGTGQWWWRPYAPLALMFNEITPALVYDLPKPITLTPGDCLELSVRFPWRTAVGEVTYEPTFQVGVAVTGYAVIEG